MNKHELTDRYNDRDELIANALHRNHTMADLFALADWFETFEPGNWNGEYFEIDATHRLYPIHGEEDIDGNVDIVGWEIL